jgi:hypothetical protein
LEVPLKEKAAFSEQLVNKYEDEKGNKKVTPKPQNTQNDR